MINWLDVLLFTLIFYCAAAGFRRGLVRQLFDVTGVIAAYLVALYYSGAFMDWLGLYLPLTRWLPSKLDATLPGGLVLGDVITRIVGFVVLFIAVRLVLKAVAGVLHGIFSLPLLGTLNGLGGLLFGALKGILFSLILVGLLSLPATPFWRRALEDSVLATSILYWLPVVYWQMKDVLLKGLLAGAV